MVDEKWFGYENSFNIEHEKIWIVTPKVKFTSEKTWKDYINDVRLEITCGEAPYLVSRYDSCLLYTSTFDVFLIIIT